MADGGTNGYQIVDVIRRYIEIRDEKERMAERHAAEMKPLNEQSTAIENWLMAKLNEAGCDSFKTEAGTAFRNLRNQAKVTDAAAFHDFVVMSGETGMLTAACSGDAVKQYAAEHGGALPPGVEINSVLSVKVRRS